MSTAKRYVFIAVLAIAACGAVRAVDYGATVGITDAENLPEDGVFNVTSADATVTVDVSIADGDGALTIVKEGPGKLVLNGANTFSGGVTLKEGFLIVNHAGALGDGDIVYQGSAKRQLFLNAEGAVFANDVWVEGGSDGVKVEGELAFGKSCTLTGQIRSREGASGKFSIGGQGKTATGNTDLFSGEVRFTSPIVFSASVQLRLVTYGTMHFDNVVTAPKLSMSTAASAKGTVWFNVSGNDLGGGDPVQVYSGYIRCGAAHALDGLYWSPYCFSANKYVHSLDLNGYAQTLKAVGYVSVLGIDGSADANGYTVIGSETAALLTVSGRGAGVTDALYHGFSGKAGLVLDADPGYTLVQTNRLNTTSGDLIVSNGVFRMGERDSFVNVPSVYVGTGGRIECLTDQDLAFAACATLTVYGVFQCDPDGPNPFNDDALDIVLGPDARLILPADAELRVNSLSTVDAEGNVTVWPVERYGASSAVSQIESGTVFVPPKETTQATWTAGGATSSVGDAANWSTDPVLPDLRFSSLVATFASAGTSAAIDRPVDVSGLIFDAPGDFTLSGAADNTVSIGADGFSVAGGAYAYTVEPRIKATVSDVWTLALPEGASLSLQGGLVHEGGVTLASGTFALGGTNEIDGRLGFDAGRLTLSGVLTQSGGPVGGNVNSDQDDAFAVYCAEEGDQLVLDGVTVEKPLYTTGRNLPSSENYDYSKNWIVVNAGTTNRFRSGVCLNVPSTIALPDGASLAFDGPVCFNGGLVFGTVDMASGYAQQARARVTLSAPIWQGGTLAVWGGVTLRLSAGGTLLQTAGGDLRPLEIDDGFSRMNAALELAADHAIGSASYVLVGCCGKVDFTSTKQYWPALNTLKRDKCRAATVMTGLPGSELQVADGTIIQKVEGALSLRACGPDGSFFGLTNVVASSCGDIAVDSGTLAFDAGSSWLVGTNVTVQGTGRLEIAQSRTFNRRHAVLRIADDGVVSIPEGVRQTVKSLYLDGVRMSPGVYGSAESSAPNKSLAAHFAGKGCLAVSGGMVVLVR